MNKQRIKIILLALTALILLYWLISSKEVQPELSKQPQVTGEQPRIDSIMKTSEKKEVEIDEHDIEQAKKIRNVLLSANREFSFFGRLIDQDGNPISGANVKLMMLKSTGMPFPPLNMRRSVEMETTNVSGDFSLKNEQALDITIQSIEKEGYEFGQVRQDFPLHRKEDREQVGQEKNPVEFHGWKVKELATALIHGNGLFGFDLDGRTDTVDLVSKKHFKGRKTGDVIVSCVRPQKRLSAATQFDWFITLEGSGGGIIESSGELMYEAPLDGYKQKLVVGFKADDPMFAQSEKGSFYIKSRGGTYGRVEMDFIPKYNDLCAIKMKWWINPNGSRNLLYDPKKRIYPK